MIRIGNSGWLCSVLFCAFLVEAGSPTAAETSISSGLASPVVRIQLPAIATLTIKTWDRPDVQVDADTGAVTVDRSVSRVDSDLAPILIRVARVQRPEGTITLPAESFVVSGVARGVHDVVKITAGKHPEGNVTVTLPASTAVVSASIERGTLVMHDYHGTFIVHVRTGAAQFQNVGGDGFVQVLQGPVQANDSNFNRLRVRTALGNAIFEHCRARQIEALSVEGSLVYDAGVFEPGLARFDSADGVVVIGSTNAAELVGSTGAGGRTFTQFDRSAQISSRNGGSTVLYSGGGPLVNAFSANGNVYLYDGSLTAKHKLTPVWRPALMALRNDPGLIAEERRVRAMAQPISVPTTAPLPPARRKPRGISPSIPPGGFGPVPGY